MSMTDDSHLKVSRSYIRKTLNNMEETELLKKRFAELADRSYTKGQFTFT